MLFNDDVSYFYELQRILRGDRAQKKLTIQKIRDELRFFIRNDCSGRCALEILPDLIFMPDFPGPSIATLVFDFVKSVAKKVSVEKRKECLDLIVQSWERAENSSHKEAIITALVKLASEGWKLEGLRTKTETWHGGTSNNDDLLWYLRSIQAQYPN